MEATQVRTFLIADVRGYTRFTVEHGDEAAARLTATFARLAREAAAAHDGQVIELRGDEALAVFSSARQALRAAVDLQVRLVEAERGEPSLPLRVGIGIDAGEAVRVEDGYRGTALNLAARLCSLAGPREVLASEGVVHLARRTPGLIYTERGLVELKGFVEPVRVIQVLSETETFEDVEAGSPEAKSTLPQPAPPIGAFLGALPPRSLVGREDEMARVVPTIDAVEAGSGQLVMVAGETGIGRTRLAQEIVVLARDRGFLVATGRCYQSERDVPLFPFLEVMGTAQRAAPAAIRARVVRQWPALSRLLPQQTGALVGFEEEEPEDGQRLFRAVAGFLSAIAEQGPLALVLDDLHWADEESLRLLHHLARQTRAQPILLVGTYRDSDLERDSALDHLLRELSRERLVDRLTLRRLPFEGTAAMVSAMVGDMAAAQDFSEFVHRRTKGNPYFVEEMLRALGGRYRLVRLVGAGGMGRVFQAVDTKTGKVVAAKILFASSEADLDALLRFQQEGTVLSTLKHPNIVEVYGTFLEEHTSCIIMELLEGRSLGQILRDEQVELARIKGIVQQAAAALAYAHSKSVAHRDVKPDNIMVLPDDRVKVTDFGIARILRPGGTLNTMSGMTLGTPLYMAPEQIEGGQVDGRADVYSLGAVVYQALAGRPPFEGDDPITVAFRHVHDAPEPPSRVRPGVPADWEALILKALAKDPANRYPTAAAFERAIAQLSIDPAQPESIMPELVVAAPRRRQIGVRTPRPAPARLKDAGPAPRALPTPVTPVATKPRAEAVQSWRHRVAPGVRVPWRAFLVLPGAVILAAIAFLVAHVLSPAPSISVMGQPVAGWAIHTTATPFNFPQAVAVDAAGIVYVADELNNRIARLSADGTPLAPWGSAGSGPGQFNHPAAVSVDEQGNVYVADTGNNRIQKLSPDGAPLDQWGAAGSGNFSHPGGIAVDRHGAVYVADTGSGRVAVLRQDGSVVRQWPVSTPAGLPGSPVAVAIDSEGDVYVVDQPNNLVERYTSGGRLRNAFGGPGRAASLLNLPSGLAVDSAGDVFVADTLNHRIQRFAPSGKVLDWAGTGLLFSQPLGLATDRFGSLYVVDANLNTIEKLSTRGKKLAVWTGRVANGPMLTNPNGISADAAANVYVADTGHNRILKVAPDGRLLASWGTRGTRNAQFRGPIGVAVGATGNVFVADTNNNRIQKLSSAGRASPPLGSAGTGLGQFTAPWGIALDGHGRMYVVDTGNNRIQAFSPAGALIRAWGSSGTGHSQFAGPDGIAVAPNGTVYVADAGNGRIQIFDAHDRFLAAWDGSSAGRFVAPQGVAVDAHGSVYVADMGTNRIEELSPQGKVLSVVGLQGSRSGGPAAPSGIAVDAQDDVYVSTGDSRLVKIVPRG